MPLEQYGFGVGGIFAVRTDISNPTPTRLGTVQDISVELSHTVKELMGQYQAPVAVARAGIKITWKAKMAKLNARAWNDTFYGQTLATGSAVQVLDEGGPTGTAIPGTPYALTVANSASMSAGTPGVDLGVYFAATGVQLTRVASAPTTGQYSFASSTGIYTFAAADTTLKVVISYQYEQTTTGGRITASNQLMGHAPAFRLHLGNSYQSNKQNMILYACIATKLSFGMKNEDFEIPEIDGSGFADSLGRYYDWSSDYV